MIGAGAMLVGIVAALAVRTVFPSSHVLPVIPFVSSLGGLVSLLLTAWIVQMSAERSRRVLPL